MLELDVPATGSKQLTWFVVDSLFQNFFDRDNDDDGAGGVAFPDFFNGLRQVPQLGSQQLK